MTDKTGAEILADLEWALNGNPFVTMIPVRDFRALSSAFKALEVENASIAARVEAETIKRCDNRIVEIAIGDRERRIVRQAIRALPRLYGERDDAANV